MRRVLCIELHENAQDNVVSQARSKRKKKLVPDLPGFVYHLKTGRGSGPAATSFMFCGAVLLG